MEKYTYEVLIEANSKEEAKNIVKHACDIVKKLNEKELQKLADIVTNDPFKTAMAKRALGV